MWWLIQLHSFWTIGTPILTSHDNLPYYESMILHATNPAMKKWTSYNAHTFFCLYKCGTYCHSASGLTQHSTHCFQNPANWHASFPLNPTIWPPQTPLPTGAGPPTPSTSPILPDHPSPLYSHPVTPNPASPHWHHWITNARGVRTWVHPYLNSLILSNKYHNITDITGYRAALWHRWLWATWRCPPPPPDDLHVEDIFFPYSSHSKFKLADLLFQWVQMAGSKISDLMDIWVACQQIYNIDPTYGPPFSSSQDLYNTIDSMEIGGIVWQAFTVEYNGEIPNGEEILHGRGSHMRSGSKIPSRLLRPGLLTRTTPVRWIVHWSVCLAGHKNINIWISCWVIGHGNRQYKISFCVWSGSLWYIRHHCRGPRNTWVHVCICHSQEW